MNIAIFSDSYRPYVSGVVRSIEAYTRALAAQGHRVYLFVPRYRRSSPAGDEAGIFRFCSLPAPTNRDFALAIPLARGLVPLLRRLQIQVVHVHSPFLMGELGHWAGRRLGVPVVFTYHTLYEEYAHYVPLPFGLSRRAARWFSRRFCNRCDLVITPTPGIQQILRSYGVTSPLLALPTGISLAPFRQADPAWLRRHLGWAETGLEILLFVGRLGKEKNLEFLLRAFDRVHRQRPGTRLVLVAGGPEEHNLRRLARELGLEGAVLFAGPVPPEQVPAYYAGADLFVFASVTETQGLVLVEAKAAGLPVVAVNASGSRDVVADGCDGVLVPANEAAFAQAVLQLLADRPRLQAMGDRARANAEQYDMSRLAEQLAQAYQGLQRQSGVKE